jgi:peptide/nickel transport system permease protein
MKRHSKLLMVSLAFLGTMALLALARNAIAHDGSPVIRFAPDTVDMAKRLQPPGAEHWLGTDELGRDLLSRMIHGSAVSLAVGFTAAAIALLVGSLLGAIAGFYGGAVDWIVSRLVELVLCFPFLFLVLAIVAFFPQSLLTIILALGLTSWTNEARLVRAEFLRLKGREFSEAARASGARDHRIIVRHLLPNALAPVIALASFGVGSAILIESALSFLGLGVPLPMASWGSILATADDYMGHAWWLALFPGLAIFLTVAACNVLGDSLRDAMDPASR